MLGTAPGNGAAWIARARVYPANVTAMEQYRASRGTPYRQERRSDRSVTVKRGENVAASDMRWS